MKYPLALALALIATLCLVGANVESGMNDDWSFIRTAQQLAATGHLRYNAWAAPLIGFQAYWGALFIKVFGFSFFAARLSVWLLALLSIPVLWSLLGAAELLVRQAFACLILFFFSPLVLPNLATFMTDMPAFYLFAVSLFCALKAWNKRSLGWIAAATLFSFLSGSIRQIYWLAGLCFLAVVAVKAMRSARERLLIAVCAALIVGFGAAASRWLAQQPYVPFDNTADVLRQSPLAPMVSGSLAEVSRGFVGLAVLALPLTLPLACRQVRRIPVWLQMLVLAGGVALPFFLANPLPWLGNILTNYGVILSGTVSLGDKPVILSQPLLLTIASLGIVAAVYTLVSVRHSYQTMSIGLKRLLALTMPFLLLYTLFITLRAPAFGIYDRYLIPYLFLVLAALSSMLPKRAIFASGIGLVFISYAIATTHDFFAEAKARLKATDEVLAAGNPRTAVLSGFEFDSWTQLEYGGHLNNELVQFPADSYRELDNCTGPKETQSWWRDMMPSLQARYLVTLSPLPGMQPSQFSPVAYHRWLPPVQDWVYVQTVGTGNPALTCQP